VAWKGTIMVVRRGFALISALVLGLVTPAGAQDPLAGYEKVRRLAIGGEGVGTFSRLTQAPRDFLSRGARTWWSWISKPRR
jgi:hypothetical protein